VLVTNKLFSLSRSFSPNYKKNSIFFKIPATGSYRDELRVEIERQQRFRLKNDFCRLFLLFESQNASIEQSVNQMSARTIPTRATTASTLQPRHVPLFCVVVVFF
jgi:hypothetical protein